MTRSKLDVPVPRVALSPREAAGALGRSEAFFAEHVQPELKVVRIQSAVLIPVRELERYLIENAEAVLS